MTSKERMIIAMSNGIPDRVPACPDMSNMIPARLTGKPFWDIYMHSDPPLWRAYIDALKYFGTDGWFIYGALSYTTNSKIELKSNETRMVDDRYITDIVYSTPAGDLAYEYTYYRADPPTVSKKPIKDIAAEFDKIRYFYSDITGYDTAGFEQQRAELGDLGAIGLGGGYPGFQQWFGFVNGIDDLAYAYYDHPDIIEEWRVLEDAQCCRYIELQLGAKPDFIILGGSGSITLQSPELFRKLSLPTIKKVTKMAKEAGIPTILHSCGKERALVEMVANETDLNCVNPLEIPPMGDCDLAEIKQTFGHKIALMGNLHTTDLMLKGTVDEVEKAAIKCIEDAGKGGGFILSTGDQCGRDTPDENMFKLVEVCEKYGRY